MFIISHVAAHRYAPTGHIRAYVKLQHELMIRSLNLIIEEVVLFMSSLQTSVFLFETAVFGLFTALSLCVVVLPKPACKTC